MKIVFLSNYFNHHQKPLSDELFRVTNGDYIFVATEKMSDERKNMGWGDISTPEYVKQYDEEKGVWVDENGKELYDYLERVSCYCCGNKNLRECKAVIRNFPEYWQKIKDMETRIGQPYKGIGTDVIEQKGIDDLEKQKEKTAAKKLKNAEIPLF